MYENFFGLRERPFDLTANPRFLFLTPKHREALSNLQYGIQSFKGLTVLLGEAGTGKTTLARAALALQRDMNVRSVYINNPMLTAAEFFDMLASGFGLSPEAAVSKPRFLAEVARAAEEQRRLGGTLAVLVDEAQSLPFELLEEIRLLSNVETATEKLVPLVLLAQPELADRLNDPSLRQLKQRVALRCTLAPLDLRETAAYLTKRVRVAGGDVASIFTREAVETIYSHSRGIPRLINVICDNALVSAFALERRPLGADIVREVCHDFDLEPAPPLQLVAGASRVEEPRPQPREARYEEPRVAQAGARAVAAAPDDRPASIADTRGSGELFATVTRRRRFLFF